MNTYRIALGRVEYYAKEYIVEASMQDIIERIGLGSRNGTVYDSNGNKTGQWRMTDHEQECGK